MKALRLVFMLFLLAVVAVYVTACRQKTEKARREPLVMLDGDMKMELPDKEKGVADNSQCNVCHINYEVEELAVKHALANVGCQKCHGASDAHRMDKDNNTPPDIMYAADTVNSSCKKCHPDGKLAEGKKYCTECHGQHRLSQRTRRWDKTTRELIRD